MPRSQRIANGPPGLRDSEIGRDSAHAVAFIDMGDRWTASVALAADAVALRRYRLDHGAYPATLDELVPTYLKVVTLNPYTDREPEYVRQGAGFELRASVPTIPVPPNAIKIPGRTSLFEWKMPR